MWDFIRGSSILNVVLLHPRVINLKSLVTPMVPRRVTIEKKSITNCEIPSSDPHNWLMVLFKTRDEKQFRLAHPNHLTEAVNPLSEITTPRKRSSRKSRRFQYPMISSAPRCQPFSIPDFVYASERDDALSEVSIDDELLLLESEEEFSGHSSIPFSTSACDFRHLSPQSRPMSKESERTETTIDTGASAEIDLTNPWGIKMITLDDYQDDEASWPSDELLQRRTQSAILPEHSKNRECSDFRDATAARDDEEANHWCYDSMRTLRNDEVVELYTDLESHEAHKRSLDGPFVLG